MSCLELKKTSQGPIPSQEAGCRAATASSPGKGASLLPHRLPPFRSCFLLLSLPQHPCFLLPSGGIAPHVAVGVPGQGRPRGSALLLPRLSPRPRGPGVRAAGEGGQEAQAEAPVHEAVDDGVDTGGRVGQQEDEGDGRPRELALGRGRVVGAPGVGAEDGHPAQEEERHDDHEHADHPLLGQQVGGGAAAADAAGPAAAGDGQALQLQLPAGLRPLQVAAVAVLVPAAAAGARLPLCVGKDTAYGSGRAMPPSGRAPPPTRGPIQRERKDGAGNMGQH